MTVQVIKTSLWKCLDDEKAGETHNSRGKLLKRSIAPSMSDNQYLTYFYK